MSKFKKPKSFAYNMVVIGAGSAGLVTSYIGAATKGKVAFIDWLEYHHLIVIKDAIQVLLAIGFIQKLIKRLKSK